MQVVMYSMYDKLAESYNNPIFFENREIAVATICRECELVAASDDEYKKRVLKDTEFVEIGTFDTKTGDVENYELKDRFYVIGEHFVNAEV